MTVRERINEAADRLTTAERKLSASILSDYPYAGLEPINVLAERSTVSSPSISRFVNKLGFAGYQEFQRSLISELKEAQRSPAQLMRDRAAPDGAYLREFADRAVGLIDEATLAVTDPQFQRICDLLSDPKRRLFLLGGRISDVIAQMLSRHLKRMRGDVFHLDPDPETWPEHLRVMRPKDILFLVDFRRYQPNLTRLARHATANRHASLVLLTDKWISPAQAFASETLALPVDSGTVWDSYAGAFTLVEAMLTRIAEQTWPASRQEIELWDSLLPSQPGDTHDD